MARFDGKNENYDINDFDLSLFDLVNEQLENVADNIETDLPLHIDLDKQPTPETLSTTCEICHTVITAKTKRYLSIKKNRHRKAKHSGNHVFHYISILISSGYTFLTIPFKFC